MVLDIMPLVNESTMRIRYSSLSSWWKRWSGRGTNCLTLYLCSSASKNTYQLRRRNFSTKEHTTEGLRHQIEERLSREFGRNYINYSDTMKKHKLFESGDWTLNYNDANLHMVLSKKIQDDHVLVEFRPSVFSRSWRQKEQELKSSEQLQESDIQTSSDEPSSSTDNGLLSQTHEITDFCVTYKKSTGAGISLFCTTVSSSPSSSQKGPPRRLLVGNIRCFNSEDESNNLFSYNGPEASDLSFPLQESFNEWLATLGVNEDICDIIDKLASNKEQCEYIRWLDGMAKLFGS